MDAGRDSSDFGLCIVIIMRYYYYALLALVRDVVLPSHVTALAGYSSRL